MRATRSYGIALIRPNRSKNRITASGRLSGTNRDRDGATSHHGSIGYSPMEGVTKHLHAIGNDHPTTTTNRASRCSPRLGTP